MLPTDSETETSATNTYLLTPYFFHVANYIFPPASADYVTRCKIHTSYTHGYYVPVLLLLSLRHALTLQVGDRLVLGPLAVPQAGGDHGHAGGGGGVEEEGQGIPVGVVQF